MNDKKYKSCPDLQCDNMKLFTYNLLSSHGRGMGLLVFPWHLQATEICINPVEFNPDFMAQMIPKVKWAMLVQAADNSILAKVPKEPSDS
jgi:multifunctional methyltransferase subunit TRM112